MDKLTIRKPHPENNMATHNGLYERFLWPAVDVVRYAPPHMILLGMLALLIPGFLALYFILHLVAPKPRAPLPSEKTYLTSSPKHGRNTTAQLPCWYDRWLAEQRRQRQANEDAPDLGLIEPAEVAMSVVVPAYNEESRILPTLEEMVEYLDARFGRDPPAKSTQTALVSPTTPKRLALKKHQAVPEPLTGYEIIIVNDGSTDCTVQVALDFARDRGLHDIVRVVTLAKNRGKGGGVTHGFRHARGEYVVFADADGASKFSDLGKLVEGCEDVVDGSNRGVAIGSRGHLVGSEAVVKVCFVWEADLFSPLMRAKHPEDVTYICYYHTALGSSQLPHEVISLCAYDFDPASNLAHPRHPVWFQALQPRRAAPHHPVHAL